MKLKDWEQHSSRYCSASIIVVVKSLSVVQKRFFGGGLGSEGLHSYHAAHLCPFVKSSESVIEFTASQVYSHCCGSSRLFLKIKTKQNKKNSIRTLKDLQRGRKTGSRGVRLKTMNDKDKRTWYYRSITTRGRWECLNVDLCSWRCTLRHFSSCCDTVLYNKKTTQNKSTNERPVVRYSRSVYKHRDPRRCGAAFKWMKRSCL